MDPALIPSLVDAGSTAVLATVLIVVLRRPPAVAMLDRSVDAWIDRLEGALDQSERRELVREANDALHRAWDSEVLLIIATSADAAEIRDRIKTLGPPPRLSPEPSEWLTVRHQQARRRARREAAPLGPEVPLPRT